MKKIAILSIFMLMGLLAYPQSQLENPGFEEWEDIEGLPEPEPVNWSSIKTARANPPYLNNSAPIVWWRSEDAHSGNYSLKLKNIYVSLIDKVATGTITNGRVNTELLPSGQYIFTDVNDPNWHSTFTTRPDSVAGWYKWYPINNDSLQIRVLLHKGEAKIPDAGLPENWVGMAFFKSGSDTLDEWTRFSIQFEYFSEESPEYALVILNSGNGFDPQEYSIAYFDDIEMIHNIPVGLTEMETQSFQVYFDRFKNLVFKGATVTDFNTIRIIDMTGRTIWSASVSSDQMNLPAVNLKYGLYLISLENNKGRYVQKIMME